MVKVVNGPVDDATLAKVLQPGEDLEQRLALVQGRLAKVLVRHD